MIKRYQSTNPSVIGQPLLREVEHDGNDTISRHIMTNEINTFFIVKNLNSRQREIDFAKLTEAFNVLM